MRILVNPSLIREAKQSFLVRFVSIFFNRRAHSSSSSNSSTYDGLENGTSKKERLEEERKKLELKAEEERLTYVSLFAY